MQNFINVVFGGSWKTSVMGYIAAIFTGILPMIQSGTFTWRQVAIAAFCAGAGRLVAEEQKIEGK